MHGIIEIITGYIIQFIDTTDYIGIFILMTLESALIPLPSEITMPFSGFLVQQGELNFWLVVLAGAFGNLVGSWIAYGIGYYLEEHVILGWIRKWGKFLLITEHEYERSIHWLRKYGDAVAFFSRVLPAVRTFISLPAGLAEMNIWKFSFYTFTGSLIWSGLLTYVGVRFGSEWHILEPYFRQFQMALGAIFLVFILWYINHKLKIIKLPKFGR
ncbi:MAG: DedA family protein [Candidatus Levybacteria bacterium]|nr:DedA family protein [Candidatus Levybacteria bacterium]